MTERAGLLWRLAPAILVLLLAAAIVFRPEARGELANPAAPTDVLAGVLDEMPDDALVLVGFDPDIGTYAELRPTVRALLVDLVERGARLALVSLTPEGRALAIAERARLLRTGVAAERLLDLGFVPGGEAALVALARALDDPAGALAVRVPSSEFALAVVVGGNDLGPRSWVEQLRPRVDALPLVAVAPTVLLPELQPYLASGQLDALLATPRDGAAYRELTAIRAVSGDAGPSTLAILLGMLAALAVLGAGVGRRIADAMRQVRARETP